MEECPRRRIRILQLLYRDTAWLDPLRPLARRLVRTFIGQDLGVITKQHDGLHKLTGQMLVGDADAPMLVYLGLRRGWARAHREGREFFNPVREAVLRWRT